MAVLTTALLTSTFAIPALERAEMNDFASGHGSWGADVRSYLRNPIDYFAQRSPGARGSGQLIQSKHHMFKLPRSGVKPQEQVLSNVRYGTPVSPYINDLLPGGPGLIDYSAPIPAIGSGIVTGGPPGTSTPVVPVGPGSTPAGNPSGNPAGTTVPETSTWLMMIWGMGLIGFGLRSPHRHRLAGIGLRARI